MFIRSKNKKRERFEALVQHLALASVQCLEKGKQRRKWYMYWEDIVHNTFYLCRQTLKSLNTKARAWMQIHDVVAESKKGYPMGSHQNHGEQKPVAPVAVIATAADE